MHISRVQLNPQRRRTRWLLASPQRMHAEVLNLYPDPSTGSQGETPRILWRLDHDGAKMFLYVVSPQIPDFSKLVEEAGWHTAPGESRDYAPLLDNLKAGDSWGFRLMANPVRYIKPEGAPRGKRVPHLTVRYQEQWMLEQAEKNGFSVGQDELGKTFGLTYRRKQRFQRGDQNVTVSMARFDGTLAVEDPELFRQALVRGIGPAKAYGCGLLTVARVGP